MSFWEDRFVNRPHAGAVPPSPYSDSQYASSQYTDPQHSDAQHSDAQHSDAQHSDAQYSDAGRTSPAGSAYPQLPSPDDEHAWGSETTPPADEVADPVEATEVEQAEVADDPTFTDAEDEPVQEPERRGLFRRRKPVLVEADDEAAVEDEPVFEAAELQVEADVTEPEAWSIVSEPEGDYESDDELTEPAEDEPARKRGLFRRRKHDAVEDASEQEAELEVESEQEPDPEHDHWYAPDGEDEHDELAAEADTFEAPDEQPKKRGLFRRRKSEPVAGPLDEDAEASAVEDDSFETAPYWGSEVTPDADEPVAEPDEAEPEPQLEEADTFVYGEEESAADDSTPEPEPQESAHDVVADGSEHTPEDEAFEPEATEPDSTEPEVYAGEDEPAEDFAAEVVASEDSAAEDTVAEQEHQPEPETGPEPAFEEWHGADESQEDYEIDSSRDEVAPEPVPLKKRNGGGSRGKKVVGLKVGASQIAAAVVTGNGDRPALVDVARRPLEQGVVVGGELRDPQALVQALKSFFKESHLPIKNVRLGLSSSRVGVRTFDIAGVEDDARFDNAVRFKAHEVLPVAANESVLDYRVVEERYTESGEVSRRVLLVVAPRDQVEPYIEACREAGIRLAGVDLESFGLMRAFVPPFGSRSRTEDSATVVVAIGHEASTLLVAGGGICEFTRVFDWGGGALQTAIADELEVPHMEAATILTHLSLNGPGRHLDSLDADTRSRALEAVRARLTPFARELVSSLQFYQTQPESLGIREILITGGTAHLEGLADSLHQMIGVNVSLGDPLGRVDVQVDIPPALEATIGSLAVPIGLAIEDEAGRSVNLLPKEARQTRKPPRLLAVAGPLAAAVPLAALAFMFMQASGSAGDQQAELDAVRAQIAALPEPTKANIDPALAGEQASRATAVAEILGGRLTWERVLGDVSRVLPEGVSLTELAATAPQPSTPVVAATTSDGESATPSQPAPAPVTAPTTPTGVTVTGYALDYATIARTLARLQAVPSLTNAELQSATPSTIGKKRIIEFTIVAALATPGGVQ